MQPARQQAAAGSKPAARQAKSKANVALGGLLTECGGKGKRERARKQEVFMARHRSSTYREQRTNKHVRAQCEPNKGRSTFKPKGRKMRFRPLFGSRKLVGVAELGVGEFLGRTCRYQGAARLCVSMDGGILDQTINVGWQGRKWRRRRRGGGEGRRRRGQYFIFNLSSAVFFSPFSSFYSQFPYHY
jgi:hypothetical protein